MSRFWGPAVVGNAEEVLWNHAGDVVGFNNPSIINQYLVQLLVSDPTACAGSGVATGKFSSVISLFANTGS